MHHRLESRVGSTVAALAVAVGMNLASVPAEAAGHHSATRAARCVSGHHTRPCAPARSRAVWRRALPPATVNPTRATAQAPSAATPAVATVSPATAEIALVNQDRAAAGLPPLQESAVLDQIATERALDMVRNGYFGHYRPGDPTLAVLELLRAHGVAFSWYGENIIWESGLPADQILTHFNDWWMNSPEHRANILSTHYGRIGVGEVVSGDRVYMVEDFTN